MERHLSISEWTRLFAEEQPAVSVRSAIAHLGSCAPCWGVAARAVFDLKRRGVALRFKDARRAVVEVLEAEEEAALRWLLARAAWAGLRNLEPREQASRLKKDSALQTCEMFDTVLAEAGMVSEDPYLSEARAQVAYALAGLLPDGVCPEAQREDRRGAALQMVANSRRMAANWAGSAAAIEAAQRHLALGTGDPLQEARLLSTKASLASDTGHLEESLTLLDRAAAIARRSQDSELLASLAVKEAGTLLAAFRYEEAVSKAEQALGLVSGSRLELLARSIITESLLFLGRASDAGRSFSVSLPLFDRFAVLRIELRRATWRRCYSIPTDAREMLRGPSGTSSSRAWRLNNTRTPS